MLLKYNLTPRRATEFSLASPRRRSGDSMHVDFNCAVLKLRIVNHRDHVAFV
jgi:hypothetical protein